MVCKVLLNNLVDRGLDGEKRTLFVLDGSKALNKAIIEILDNRALIQRCQKHKRDNVRGHLANADQAGIDARLYSLHRMIRLTLTTILRERASMVTILPHPRKRYGTPTRGKVMLSSFYHAYLLDNIFSNVMAFLRYP